MGMQEGPAPAEALREAVAALQDGRFDARSLEGAKLNTLESIAWSLIGLLATSEAKGKRPEATIQETLEKAGFVHVSKRA